MLCGLCVKPCRICVVSIYPVLCVMCKLYQSVFQLSFQLLQFLSDGWSQRLKLLNLQPTNTHGTPGLLFIIVSSNISTVHITVKHSIGLLLWVTCQQGSGVYRLELAAGWLTVPDPSSDCGTSSDSVSSVETLPKTVNRDRGRSRETEYIDNVSISS